MKRKFYTLPLLLATVAFVNQQKLDAGATAPHEPIVGICGVNCGEACMGPCDPPPTYPWWCNLVWLYTC